MRLFAVVMEAESEAARWHAVGYDQPYRDPRPRL